MFVNVNQRRLLTIKNIALNPVSVTITRYPMIDDGIGGSHRDTQNPQTILAQDIRVFMTSWGTPRTSTSEGGIIQVQKWGLLARWDADIEKEDEFTIDNQAFRVTEVNPVRCLGEIVSLQVDVEEVS